MLPLVLSYLFGIGQSLLVDFDSSYLFVAGQPLSVDFDLCASTRLAFF